MALIKWGKVNVDSGIKTLDEAYQIFTEYREHPLNQREKDYIKIGYNRDIER